MAKPISSNKRENEKKKQSKRLEKQKKKEERKTEGKSRSFEDMIAYVDENGMITSTPPDMSKKEDTNTEEIRISTPKKTESDEEVTVNKGRIEHFNTSKGYGFIKSLAGTDKYFFHVSNTPGNLVEGDIVVFELERGPRGMNTVNIKKADK